MELSDIKQNFRNSIINSDLHYDNMQLGDIFNIYEKSLIEICNRFEHDVIKADSQAVNFAGNEDYYKSCEKIVLQVIKQMPNKVFSELDIDGETVKRVYTQNGISFEHTVDKYYH